VTVDALALARGLTDPLIALAASGGESSGLTINWFWIFVSLMNFAVFFYIVWKVVLVPVGGRLSDRRDRIEQGLRDADTARRDREAAADQRAAVLAEARREAGEILARAQKLADDQRQKGVTETQAEIGRLREQALADIDAERLRALADVRGQVADLALMAAGKVVGETMSEARERRLVDEFLAQVSAAAPRGDERN
jgi:F-type H+-transporting ATPase subunit b